MVMRWEPFREMRRMEEMMNRLWRGLGGDTGTLDIGATTMPMDVIETNDNVVVRVAVPGINPEEIAVDLEDDVLTVSAERREDATREEQQGRYLIRESAEGMFRRSVRLPNIIDPDNAQSACENGMLTITFPKQEQKKARRIQIGAGGQQQLGAGPEERAA